MLVDVDRDENGVPKIDSYGMYSFTSDQKKDAAYSLIYANFIRVIYSFLMDNDIVDGRQRGRKVVCSSAPIIVN
jgi:hypothetical protein